MSFGSKQTQATNQATTNYGTQNATSTATRDPYAAAKPGLDQAASMATRWMSDPSNYAAYSGPRVAQMSDMTAAGLGGMFGQQGASNSMGYLNDVIGGKYLDAGNPHLAALTDSIRSQVMPSINSQFSAAGMNGSTLHQGSLARGMTDALAAPLFQQYNAERGLQQQAAGMLPTIDQAAQAARVTAGQAGEGYQQRNLDAAMAAYNEEQQKKLAALQAGTGILGSIGSVGGTTSTSGTTSSSGGGTTNGTTETSQNPGLAQMLAGGAMMGASLFGGPMAGMFGSGLGGMFGGGLGGGLGSFVSPTTNVMPTNYGFGRSASGGL